MFAREYVEDFVCPDCGYEGEAEVTRGTYGDDADGNRGVPMTCYHCPECEAEVCSY